MIALVPLLGYRSVTLPLPSPNPIAGVPVVGAHIVLDFQLDVRGVSSPAQFLTF